MPFFTLRSACAKSGPSEKPGDKGVCPLNCNLINVVGRADYINHNNTCPPGLLKLPKALLKHGGSAKIGKSVYLGQLLYNFSESQSWEELQEEENVTIGWNIFWRKIQIHSHSYCIHDLTRPAQDRCKIGTRSAHCQPKTGAISAQDWRKTEARLA